MNDTDKFANAIERAGALGVVLVVLGAVALFLYRNASWIRAAISRWRLGG